MNHHNVLSEFLASLSVLAAVLLLAALGAPVTP